MTTLPNEVRGSGQVVITEGPDLHAGFKQNIQGGLIEASAAKTASSIAEQASHVKALGGTMRGSGRKKRRYHFMKGGNDYEVHPPYIPEGGSIPGISHANIHGGLINNLNQMKSGAVYDGLANATPYKVGGMRLPGEKKDGYPFGGRKRSRKVKKHGRLSKHRSNRRNRRSNANRTRRSSRRHR